jgi:hypothetical protein
MISSKSTQEIRQCIATLDKYIPVFFDYLDEAQLFKERKTSLEKYNRELEQHRRKAHSHPEVENIMTKCANF